MRFKTKKFVLIGLVGFFFVIWRGNTDRDVAVAQSRKAVVITRIFTGPDGLAHAEDIELNLNARGATDMLKATGAEFSVATARADDTFAPHHWCPGQRHDPPTGPGDVVWDWNVCHTFYFTNYGMGNVVTSYSGENAPVWDGDNPPIEAITRRHCPPIAFMCP